jgi:hypothetical protein
MPFAPVTLSERVLRGAADPLWPRVSTGVERG